MMQVVTFLYSASLVGKLVAGPTVAYVGEGRGGGGAISRMAMFVVFNCHLGIEALRFGCKSGSSLVWAEEEMWVLLGGG